MQGRGLIDISGLIHDEGCLYKYELFYGAN